MTLEKLLKKAKHFVWPKECDAAFNTLKENLTSAPILVYLDWNKEFHDHPIYFLLVEKFLMMKGIIQQLSGRLSLWCIHFKSLGII